MPISGKAPAKYFKPLANNSLFVLFVIVQNF